MNVASPILLSFLIVHIQGRCTLKYNVDKKLLPITPFPNEKFYTLPNPKFLADNNFKLNENDRKFSRRVENTEGKGEIARYEQFLLCPQCFQTTYTANT